MFCAQCGIQNTDESKFCKSCGAGLIEPSSPCINLDDKKHYANFWNRLSAFVIDSIIVGIGTIAIAFIIRQIANIIAGDYVSQNGLPDPLVFVELLLPGLLYNSIMESSSKQATIGKNAAGIWVSDINGNKITFTRALVRNSSKLLSAAIVFFGFFQVAFTQRKQALHDMISDCLVLSKGLPAVQDQTQYTNI